MAVEALLLINQLCVYLMRSTNMINYVKRLTRYMHFLDINKYHDFYCPLKFND